LKHDCVMDYPILDRSPLAQGRGLKQYPPRLNLIRMESPLAQGRGLKPQTYNL